MTLYLSSYQIGDAPERLVELLGPNKHAALILNASDVYGDSQRPAYVKRFQAEFAELGITSEELDLRKYFPTDVLRSVDLEKVSQLAQDLTRFGLIWAAGGNTFVLRRAFALSGLDQLLPPLLAQNQVVYGGFSAGACVVTPTLKGLDLVDPPDEIPPGYPAEVMWNGLGLVNFHIAPHFKSPHPESAAVDDVVAYFKKHQMPYHALQDGEAVVVDNGKVEVVGAHFQR